MSNESTREIVEGIQYQGEDEEIVYTIDVTAVGDSPISPVLTVKDETDLFNDVTSTVATGSASANGNVITLPAIHSLTAGKFYRCEVAFDIGGNDLEHYFRIRAER
jgi:hypothetical protein